MKDTERSGEHYSIGTVKAATGLTERRIRYYETLNLLTPTRTQGNQRIYSQQDVDRLKQIKQLLDNGVSLKEIRDHLKHQDVVSQRDDSVERDAESYFEGKRIAHGKPPSSSSLYPLWNRAEIIRRIQRGDDDRKGR